ncbi:MAG: hypothetical protein HY717_22450, partial [Planctomycetes bacterium]|nr:hypothetical protein [Planctomycetota bacterium]
SDSSRRLLESDFPKFKLLLHEAGSGYAGAHRLFWILSNRPPAGKN